MIRKILVLFDTIDIRKEVVRYAIGLAKRTDSALMLLIILHPNFWKKSDPEEAMLGQGELEKAANEALAPHISGIIREGVKVSAEVRIGDPHSEFLKFLAQNASFQTIVWGGAEPLIKAKSPKTEDHWLGRAKSIIDCPLVVPSLRS